jgi:ribosomal protein L32E
MRTVNRLSINKVKAARGAAAAAQGKRVTFDQAAEAYLQKFEDSWRKAKSIDSSGGTRGAKPSRRCSAS